VHPLLFQVVFSATKHRTIM